MIMSRVGFVIKFYCDKSSLRRKKLSLLMLVVWVGTLLAITTSVAAQSAGQVYTFGVVPQFDALRIYSVWRPILDELQLRTGLEFSLKGVASIPEFEQAFGDGAFDFVYMNPYHLLMANKKQGYLPLVRDKSKGLYGIVVVRKDSPIRKMEDLNGKLVVLPAPNALGASLLVRAAFANVFNIHVKPKYVFTHTSVYLNVALGEADAGGGVARTLSQQLPDLFNKLRILYETEKVAPHPISGHPRVPKSVRQQVRDAFLSMGLAQEGRALLSAIPIKQVGKAEMADYSPLEKLGLDRFSGN
ncbi:ABC-type phosphate/phosphonate transport system [gamma proteobacterium IMCC2047]|nr:ABC-type phosphate/phosphonate transport system [gamma proteobacterium IMCC2047]